MQRANSTFNSSITELIPCLLLYDTTNYYTFDEQFIDNLKNIAKTYKTRIFLTDNDYEYAIKILDELNIDDKQHAIKIKSAIQIFKYIKDIIDTQNYNVLNIYWCYRAKPMHVSNTNPSDIILKINTGTPKCYVGFSLKSGIKNSKESKLNSYILPILNKKIADESLTLKFYQEFNKLILNFFPDLQITDFNTLHDWTQYKIKHKRELMKIDLNSDLFRTVQNFCINFFITAFNNNKNFKDIFIKTCLVTIPSDSTDWNYFIDNRFLCN